MAPWPWQTETHAPWPWNIMHWQLWTRQTQWHTKTCMWWNQCYVVTKTLNQTDTATHKDMHVVKTHKDMHVVNEHESCVQVMTSNRNSATSHHCQSPSKSVSCFNLAMTIIVPSSTSAAIVSMPSLTLAIVVSCLTPVRATRPLPKKDAYVSVSFKEKTVTATLCFLFACVLIFRRHCHPWPGGPPPCVAKKQRPQQWCLNRPLGCRLKGHISPLHAFITFLFLLLHYKLAAEVDALTATARRARRPGSGGRRLHCWLTRDLFCLRKT